MSLYNPAEPLCRFYDDDGSPLSAGSLTIYIGEGDELAEVYDENGEAQANPVTLSARGECSIRLDDETRYRFVLRDAWGKVVWTSANYSKAVCQGHTVTINPMSGYKFLEAESLDVVLSETDDGGYSFPIIHYDMEVKIAGVQETDTHTITIVPSEGTTINELSSAEIGSFSVDDDGNWSFEIPEESATILLDASGEEKSAVSYDVTLDVSLGDITITETGYTAEGATEETAYVGGIEIVGRTTEHSVSVLSGTQFLKMSSVSIQLSDGSSASALGTAAVSVASGSNVTLTMVGTNFLQSGYGMSGVEAYSESVLTIDGTGTLKATGGTYGAGVGCGYRAADGDLESGSIYIQGSVLVEATGGDCAAGIGGGHGAGDGGTTGGDGGTVTISDSAVVTVTGSNGSGIGGGHGGTTGGDGGTVTISDSAVVTATGSYGAGIGGGGSSCIAGSGGTVTISGYASVTANSTFYGAAIGSGGYGYSASGGSVTITGHAVVVATCTSYGAAIGGGYAYSTSYTGNAGADVTISGGFVAAIVTGGSSSYSAAAIGGGAGRGASYGGDFGSLTMTGGIVLAQTRYSVSDCIGNATGGSGDVPDLTSITGGMVITYQGSSSAKTSWAMADAENISDSTITLSTDASWASGYTLTIAEGETLTIASGKTLMCYGTLSNSGTISGEVVYG